LGVSADVVGDVDVLALDDRPHGDLPEADLPLTAWPESTPAPNAIGPKQRSRGPAKPSGRAQRRGSVWPQRSRATVTADTPTAPAARRGAAHAERVAPVVATSSTRTIQRPASGLGGAAEPPAPPTRGLNRNAPRTLVARVARSRSNWAIVARARSRIGAHGRP